MPLTLRGRGSIELGLSGVGVLYIHPERKLEAWKKASALTSKALTPQGEVMDIMKHGTRGFDRKQGH